MYKNVPSSAIHSHPKLESTQMSTKSRMNKQIAITRMMEKHTRRTVSNPMAEFTDSTMGRVTLTDMAQRDRSHTPNRTFGTSLLSKHEKTSLPHAVRSQESGDPWQKGSVGTTHLLSPEPATQWCSVCGRSLSCNLMTGVLCFNERYTTIRSFKKNCP